MANGLERSSRICLIHYCILGVDRNATGSESCCATDVLEIDQICGNGVVAPCVIENYTPAPMGVPGEVQPFGELPMLLLLVLLLVVLLLLSLVLLLLLLLLVLVLLVLLLP